MNSAFRRKPLVAAIACCAALAIPPGARAEDLLTNPNWEIFVSDYGYSDYLGDHTPGFEGREYLSGEWGAAVGYSNGATTVSPTWLERNFIYPDWTTNSTFSVITPLNVNSFNADGLPIADSLIANGDISIGQRLEIVDTRVGTPMGTSPASAGGAGSAILSNRYVMMQTYTITNLTESTLDNLQFFQLLHGLNAQAGVYDDRAYTGAMSDYRYDVTLRGVDDTSSTGQFDYIGFHSNVAPTAFEIGHYGIEGIDNHFDGKPSTGVHLAIENNWQGDYADGEGTDSFAPDSRWVAGAERWDLGSLEAGQSASISVMLSIRTGWIVNPDPEGGASGSSNGGSQVPGGVDYTFEHIDGPGTFYAEYEVEDHDGIQQLVALGEIGPITFQIPGSALQLFNIEYEGSFSGMVTLTFGYDPTLLPAEFDPLNLRIYHWNGTTWDNLGGAVDPFNHTITASTDSFSPFAVGAVPEPETWAMFALGAGLVLLRLRKSRGN
ncbi:MAG: PEP-CTERM sorting domain-containing protein [Betaproteobacteria bacterium]|nr:PEP-CTERM sorting domain-containing protein [Betaproteobacteria bacterium]